MAGAHTSNLSNRQISQKVWGFIRVRRISGTVGFKPIADDDLAVSIMNWEPNRDLKILYSLNLGTPRLGSRQRPVSYSLYRLNLNPEP